MQILVDNKIQDLTIIDPQSGCDWALDLIGNADGFDDYDDDREMYTMTQESFNWWQSYIDTEQDISDRVLALRESLGNDEADKLEQALDAGDNDYESDQSGRLSVIESFNG